MRLIAAFRGAGIWMEPPLGELLHHRQGEPQASSQAMSQLSTQGSSIRHGECAARES
jgi:hypothetical protein